MRVATLNLLHGAAQYDQVVDLDRLADAVGSLDVDILALQEVDRGQPRSHHADLTEVVARAVGAKSWCFLPVLVGEMLGDLRIPARGDEGPGRPAYGLSIVSRYPATRWRSLRLPGLPVSYPRRGHDPRRIVSITEEPRAALLGEFDTPAGPLAVANAHLTFVPWSRRRQLRRLVRRLAAVPDPVLLMGDLNLAAPWPARITGYRPLATAPTFPADRPTRQIDHILLRGRLGAVARVSAPELSLSDHRPLIVDLA
ncbi:MAG: endonuclease/exonuclease/phosphatase family protein [Propionibacteriaceae bacterium]